MRCKRERRGRRLLTFNQLVNNSGISSDQLETRKGYSKQLELPLDAITRSSTLSSLFLDSINFLISGRFELSSTRLWRAIEPFRGESTSITRYQTFAQHLLRCCLALSSPSEFPSVSRPQFRTCLPLPLPHQLPIHPESVLSVGQKLG